MDYGGPKREFFQLFLTEVSESCFFYGGMCKFFSSNVQVLLYHLQASKYTVQFIAVVIVFRHIPVYAIIFIISSSRHRRTSLRSITA